MFLGENFINKNTQSDNSEESINVITEVDLLEIIHENDVQYYNASIAMVRLEHEAITTENEELLNEGVKDFLSKAWEVIKRIFKAVVDFIVSLKDRLVKFVGSFFAKKKSVMDQAKEWASKYSTTQLVAMAGGAAAAVSMIFGSTKYAYESYINPSLVAQKTQGILKEFTAYKALIKDLDKKLLATETKESEESVSNEIEKAKEDFVKKMADFGIEVSGGASNKDKIKIFDYIRGDEIQINEQFMHKHIKTLTAMASSAKSTIIDKASSGLDTIKNFAQEIATSAESAKSKSVAKLKSMYSQLASAASKVSSAIGTVINEISWFAGKVATILGNKYDQFKAWLDRNASRKEDASESVLNKYMI